MLSRRLHKYIGVCLLLPVFAWAATGVFFLFRPAFEDAYAGLAVKTYPVSSPLDLPSGEQWFEFRYLETILGKHLLVRTASGWEHRDGQTGNEFKLPSTARLTTLVADAIAENPARYGEIDDVQGSTFHTSTGVSITVIWPSLSLNQAGNDTRWINQIYDIHYLRWTGVDWLDEIVGAFGLLLLILMSITGATLLLGPRK